MTFPDVHEIDNDEMRTKLNDLASDIHSELPAGWGFTLFLFRYGHEGEMFYISSAQREDMLKVIDEWRARYAH